MKKLNFKITCWLAAFFGFALVGMNANAQGTACTSATFISCGQTVSGSTTGNNVSTGTTASAPSCNTSVGTYGVWYAMIGNGQQVDLATCGSGYDTKIHVYTGSCGALTCVVGNDDACGFQSEVSFLSSIGTIYYVLVDGFLSGNGSYTLSASCTGSSVPNDFCSGAIPVNCGDVVSGSTDQATIDNAGTCVTSNTAPGVWYSIQGTGGPINANTCSAGTNYDTKLSVYTGSCGSFTCVTGNDDDFTCSAFRSSVDWNSVAGQTYYILVHGYSANTGNFDLSINCPSPPANDDPCNATAVSIGSTSFSNEYATSTSGEIGPGAGTETSSCNSQDGWCSFETDVDNSVWFTFTAPASGCVSIVADGFDSQLALYSVTNCGDYNTYTEVAANDDSGDDIISSAGIFSAGIDQASCLTPGATYYIQVDGYNGAESANGVLTILDCGGTPLAVDAGDCQSRFIGYAPSEADTNFLVATASGGQAPYTFSWSPSPLFSVDNGGTSTAAVQPGATTTYTVTVTDDRGCTATSTVEVVVYDIAAACTGNNQVQICHVPPGNPANEHNICVGVNAVSAHLNNHDDYLGPCGNTCTATNAGVVAPPPCVTTVITVTTDRFASETSWTLTDVTAGQVVDEIQRGDYNNETTYSSTYCLDPTHCYEWRIADSFGDGICCSYGSGSYSISYDGNTVAISNSGNNPFSGSSATESFGNCSSSKSDEASAQAPESVAMIAAYPNPASDFAKVKFTATQSGSATVELFNLNGERMQVIYEGMVEGGMGNVVDLNLSNLTSGMYIYRMVTSNGEIASGKINIAK